MDHEYWTEGRLHAVTKGLRTSVGDVSADANLKLDTELRFNPKLKVNMLQKFVLRTRDMTLRGAGGDLSGWWMDVEARASRCGTKLRWRTTERSGFKRGTSIPYSRRWRKRT